MAEGLFDDGSGELVTKASNLGSERQAGVKSVDEVEECLLNPL